MERCVSFTGGARPDRNWSESRRIAAAEHLTCLSGPFGDASCLLEEVGDCGLPDFQVVGSVRLRGAHENMKSIGPAMKTRAPRQHKGLPHLTQGEMFRLGTAGGFSVAHHSNSSKIDFRLRETKARLSL